MAERQDELMSPVPIKLVQPALRMESEFLAAAKRSRALHHPWVQLPQTSEAFQKYVKRFDASTHAGYWVCTKKGDLVGAVNISEIVRGNFWSAYLGYYVFVPYSGKG